MTLSKRVVNMWDRSRNDSSPVLQLPLQRIACMDLYPIIRQAARCGVESWVMK